MLILYRQQYFDRPPDKKSLKYIGQLCFYGRRLEAGTTNSEFNEHIFSVQEEALSEAADEPKDDAKGEKQCTEKDENKLC